MNSSLSFFFFFPKIHSYSGQASEQIMGERKVEKKKGFNKFYISIYSKSENMHGVKVYDL